jgi:hypothetical protein
MYLSDNNKGTYKASNIKHHLFLITWYEVWEWDGKMSLEDGPRN